MKASHLYLIIRHKYKKYKLALFSLPVTSYKKLLFIRLIYHILYEFILNFIRHQLSYYSMSHMTLLSRMKEFLIGGF